MARNFFNITKGFNLKPQTSLPSNPIEGDVVFIDAAGAYQYLNGVWETMGGGFPFEEYNRIVGSGLGEYATLTLALAASSPGDSIYIKEGYSIAAAETVALSDILITFKPGVEITITGGSVGLAITGSRVRVNNPKYTINSVISLTQVLLVDGSDNYIQNGLITINGGPTITDVYRVNNSAHRAYLTGSINLISGTVTNKLTDNGIDTDATVRG